MPGKQFDKDEDRDCILVWASILENKRFPAGGCEVVTALINISSVKYAMDVVAAERIKQAWKNSIALKDKEIMRELKSVRNVPDFKDDWWWWPEKIK
jgi:head-tail adaptor